jgi:CheY-like chemotaxis protein
VLGFDTHGPIATFQQPQLPGGMNGRQIADAARTSRPDLKVLFITGYAENAVMRSGNSTRKRLSSPFLRKTRPTESVFVFARSDGTL